MTEVAFDLNREQNVEALVDALGKKWQIHANKQNGLCYASYVGAAENAVIPEQMEGLWTNSNRLKPKIVDYVTKTWDKADAKKLKMEREAQAAAELVIQERKDAKEAERLKLEAIAKLEEEERASDISKASPTQAKVGRSAKADSSKAGTKDKASGKPKV